MEIRYLNFDMKRFYLFIALLATSMSGFAQDVEIDETDLFGRWIQVSKSGEFTSYKKYDNDPDYSRQTPETLLHKFTFQSTKIRPIVHWSPALKTNHPNEWRG